MYTGYFSKLKKYTDAGLVPVAISRIQPSFYKGASYVKLAPSWNILSAFKHPELVGEEAASKETYIKRFTEEILDKLDAFQVVSELEKLTGVDDSKIVLLCYEKPTDFCHRHLVADWLNKNGFATAEYTTDADLAWAVLNLKNQTPSMFLGVKGNK